MIPANAIREARKAAGIRQAELAEKAGCAQQTVVDIESGKITRSSFLPKICAILGLDLDKIMAGDVPDNVIELKRHNFGNPVPLLSDEQVKTFQGSLASLAGGTTMLPCVVKHSRHSFAVKVTARTVEPRIPRGSVAFVDPDKPLTSGGFALMYLGDYTAPVLRQVFIDGPNFEAMSTHNGESVPFRRVSNPAELKRTDSETTGLIIGPVIYVGIEIP